MFSKKLELSSISGYTLIETLAVVAVISIMSLVFVSNYLATKKKTALEQAAQEIVLNLRFAQNMAMNVSRFSGQIPAGGYGIKFNASASPVNYQIFADLDGDKQYSAGEEYGNSISLDANVSASGTNNNIDFVPPDGSVYLDGLAPSGANFSMTLGYSGISLTKTIKINAYTGQITVN